MTTTSPGNGNLPQLLYNHHDDNFKRKQKYRSFGFKILFLALMFTEIETIIATNSQFTAPCNRSRLVLTELSGVISDGPNYLNYTGIIKKLAIYISIF